MNKKISIVIPVYFNQGSLKQTYSVLLNQVFGAFPTLDHETIFVDDGSGDNSLNELREIAENYPSNVSVISFTRNFGQVAAIRAGYARVSGDFVLNVSADLQDPPELFVQMIQEHLSKDTEVVAGVRVARIESKFRAWTSQVFYKVMNLLSFPNMPAGGFDIILLSRRAMQDVLADGDTNPFWQGQVLWTGYPVKFIPYTRVERLVGSSRWTLGKKIKYLLDGVLGYSYFPIRFITASGFLISLIGFAYAITIALLRLAGYITIPGWAPLAILVLLLSGFQMIMLGVIGEYLWRTLDQVRNRQPYIVSWQTSQNLSSPEDSPNTK